MLIFCFIKNKIILFCFLFIKLKNQTPLFILSIKNSKRESLIKKRLNFLRVKYKFFYALNPTNRISYSILKKKYDKKKCLNELGRDMSYSEISCAEGHLRIYKYIVKKNISNAVIMEDDCYPSKYLLDWLKLNSFFKKKNYGLIMIYHSFGLVNKKPEELILKRFSLHKTCFTLPYATCYQISKRVCNYILSRNRKISRLADWPINFYNTKIKQYALLPYVVSVYHNHANTSFHKEIWLNFKKKRKISKIIPFYNLIVALYYLFHIPFFLRIYKNYSYYKEVYLLKKIFYLKNLFSNNYINLEVTYKNKIFYSKDLIKNVRKILHF